MSPVFDLYFDDLFLNSLLLLNVKQECSNEPSIKFIESFAFGTRWHVGRWSIGTCIGAFNSRIGRSTWQKSTYSTGTTASALRRKQHQFKQRQMFTLLDLKYFLTSIRINSTAPSTIVTFHATLNCIYWMYQNAIIYQDFDVYWKEKKKKIQKHRNFF